MLDLFNTFIKSASYNMKIIFGGKFFWFLLTSFLLYGYLMFSSLWQGQLPTVRASVLPCAPADILSCSIWHTERC